MWHDEEDDDEDGNEDGGDDRDIFDSWMVETRLVFLSSGNEAFELGVPERPIDVPALQSEGFCLNEVRRVTGGAILFFEREVDDERDRFEPTDTIPRADQIPDFDPEADYNR